MKNERIKRYMEKNIEYEKTLYLILYEITDKDFDEFMENWK